jgi:hypothetical protein
MAWLLPPSCDCCQITWHGSGGVTTGFLTPVHLCYAGMRSHAWWMGLINAFSGGIFLSAGLMHLLPHCQEAQVSAGHQHTGRGMTNSPDVWGLDTVACATGSYCSGVWCCLTVGDCLMSVHVLVTMCRRASTCPSGTCTTSTPCTCC